MIKINPKKLPFKLEKTSEGYKITFETVSGYPTYYWGNSPEEAINEFWNKVVGRYIYESEQLNELRKILGVRR